MKFGSLVEQIKKEARLATDATFDATVVSLLSELFKEAVEQQRPMELRKEVLLPLTTNNGTVTLPNDFFIHHQFQFNDTDTGRQYPLTDQDKAIPPAPRGLFGHPKSFEVVTGNTVNLKPATAIVTGDNLFLVYYITPPVVTLDNLNDENPVVRLEPFLIRATIRRLRMFHIDDAQVAQMLSDDVKTAAIGYGKDEPREKSE